MPGIVPLTSTLSLNSATLDYILTIANNGWQKALREDPGLMKGLSIYQGNVTHRQTAADMDKDYIDPRSLV